MRGRGRILSGLAALLLSAMTRGADPHLPPRYLGSETCIGCHADAGKAWRGSHHDLAWTLPGPETVLADFNDTEFVHRGVTSRFSRRGADYIVKTQGPDGTLQEYKVVGVAGIAPLQQYLLETEPGRQQALDIAWDIPARRWFHLYPEQIAPAGDGLHWSGPYKSWNARCAECHATGYEKRYDPVSHHYASREAEIGVGCEACHGPGEAHQAWAQAPDDYDPSRFVGLTPQGLTIGFPADDAQAQLQQCAGCHSRREAFEDGNPLPGTPYHDAYRLTLLRDGLYHADGAILGEVYVYGSFLQSKMYASGVRCSDCHDPHGLGLKLAGNAVCTQCHSPGGSVRYSGLKPVDYDSPEHHFHPPGSDGAACKSCHMIERVYMGNDGRRDHSFRIPRPALSVQAGVPNACTDCHSNRDAAWAAAEIAARFPQSRLRGPHFSQVFAAARTDPVPQLDALNRIAGQEAQPGIVRATALELMLAATNDMVATRTRAYLGDPNPLVRAAAIPLQRGAEIDVRVARLFPMLRDPFRAVRMAAAREFLAIPPGRLSAAVAADLRAALAEWRASLLTKTDFPETHLLLGGAALGMRNLAAAEAAFREAVRLDPQRIEAWSMLVRILAASGDRAGARRALDAALNASPGEPALLSLQAGLAAEAGP